MNIAPPACRCSVSKGPGPGLGHQGPLSVLTVSDNVDLIELHRELAAGQKQCWLLFSAGEELHEVYTAEARMFAMQIQVKLKMCVFSQGGLIF